MARWTGILNVHLEPTKTSRFFRVAASLLLSPSSDSLAVPSVNAIFFNGDRVEGTENPVIERLSDGQNLARLLASKVGDDFTNAWVIDAAKFNGPFAVYKEFIPSVNSFGEPENYDPRGFPASSAVAAILSKCLEEAHNAVRNCGSRSAVARSQVSLTSTSAPTPKTIILGFSKGGIVVNQIITELAYVSSDSAGNTSNIVNSSSVTGSNSYATFICPISKESLLSSISEFHYIDVGLNCSGAYLTDHTTFMKIAEQLLRGTRTLYIALHGTPRQWCDRKRPWIRREKDMLLQYLRNEASKCDGKLQVIERLYFGNEAPSLQMHFEIIEKLEMY